MDCVLHLICLVGTLGPMVGTSVQNWLPELVTGTSYWGWAWELVPELSEQSIQLGLMDFAVIPTPPYSQFLPSALEYHFHGGYGGNMATLVATKIVHIYI